ncbi:MAG: glycosyltransferase, partial [Opitutales bacterium]|nr:glycosyltransferase [Opitutales bacterium]
MPKFLASFGHDVTIVTSQMDVIPDFLTNFFGKDVEALDAEYTKQTGVKIVRLPMYAYKSGRAINKPSLMRRVAELKPDMLYIHGESSFIAMQYLLRYSKLRHGLIFDSHMHDDAVTN